jgi:AraC-like DNA-binding protein
MNRCSFPREPVAACGIELLTVWQVVADASYTIRADRSRADSHMRNIKAGREMVAVRTLRGQGRLRCGGREHELTAGSLLIFDFPSLESYTTNGKTWTFWWFEFRPTEPFRLPLHCVLNSPRTAHEVADCAEIFRLLRMELVACRCRAAAILQSLLFEWWATAGLPGEGNDRLRQQVQQLIEAMHHNPEKPWTLAELASRAGMSISSLRTAFHQTTGKAPARLRNELRLAHAHEQLRRGDRTVAEVATQLGYCDPFHFSKAFKAVYGFPPRAVMQQSR